MWLLYGAAQLSGLAAIVCTVAWLVHFRGGYAWQSDPHLQFSWHPTLMIISMIYLYGNGEEATGHRANFKRRARNIGGAGLFSCYINVRDAVSLCCLLLSSQACETY